MPSRSQLAELVTALGGDEDAVLSAGPTEGLERFSEPARGAGGPLDVVLLPRSTDQVRTMIIWARRHLVRLLPQGANSGLVGASTPGPDGGVVVLSTDRLRGEPVIDPSDRTAVVYAGTRLSELNERLRTHGLELAIDLGADPSLGGMAATNTGGARMLRYGDMRDHVLGLEAVLADEDVSVIDELSVLRKDNTGLALSELLVGSGGALGVITRVALQLDTLPVETACAWLAPSSAHGAIQALLALEHGWGDRLSAFEVVSRDAMRIAVERVDGVRRPFGDASPPELSVLVEFVGTDSTQDALVDALAQLHGRGLIVDGVIGAPAASWAVRHAISEGLRLAGTVVGFDVSVPRSALPRFLDAVRAQVHDALPRVLLADFGHWGDGGVHCSVVVPHDDPLSGDELDELRDLVFGLTVDEYGGSFSGEHGIGPINAAWWTRTRSDGARRLTSGIKHLCDPLDLLGHPDMPYS